MRPETRTVHLPRPAVAGSVPLSTPIYQTSGFAFDDPARFAEELGRPDGAYVYARHANPTVRALEEAVAVLENGVAAIAAGSGMGAVNCVLLGLLRPGDHLIVQDALYGGTAAMINELAARFGVTVSYVPEDDPDALRAAATSRTRLVYLETIANPVGRVADLPAMCAAARELGLLSVVDNTFATPLLCRPLEHGADIVLHSVTKYLAGHSDVLGGVAVFASDALHRRVWRFAVELGASMDPFAAWLTLRGMQTLALRLERQCANAGLLAARLAAHPAVGAVHWAGLAGHRSHGVGSKLLADFGGVLAFDLAGGRAAADLFVSAVRLALLAPSLGGVETLVLHPASTTHRALGEAELARIGISQGTVRLAVGIEHPDDLLADVEQALDQALPA